MSYRFDIMQILQYATNTMFTISPLLYLFGGAAVAIFIFAGLIKLFRDKKD